MIETKDVVVEITDILSEAVKNEQAKTETYLAEIKALRKANIDLKKDIDKQKESTKFYKDELKKSNQFIKEQVEVLGQSFYGQLDNLIAKHLSQQEELIDKQDLERKYEALSRVSEKRIKRMVRLYELLYKVIIENIEDKKIISFVNNNCSVITRKIEKGGLVISTRLLNESDILADIPSFLEDNTPLNL